MKPLLDEFVWTEKWRPQTISEAILPEKMKATLLAFKDQKNIPNLLFSGSAGVGKTTVARAFCRELGLDYMFLQGSGKDRGIDTIKHKIEKFATSVSWDGADSRKMVIIDEADFLSTDAMMALRSFIEENSDNCGFILTCNYPGRFPEALISRFHLLEFKIPREEKTKLAIQFLKRLMAILKAEEIKVHSTDVLKTLVEKYFPDMRRILNALQVYSSIGQIDDGVLDYIKRADISELIEYMKEGEWSKVRKWIGENVDDPIEIILDLYNNGPKYFEIETFPQVVIYLHEGQVSMANSADKSLALMATLTKIMADARFL